MFYIYAIPIIVAVVICYCCLTISPRDTIDEDKEQVEILKEWKHAHKK